MKPAAEADLALDADLASHQLHQPANDRQPQPGAAIVPRRGGVGLLERLEHLFHLARRNADAGVADREFQIADCRLQI